MAKVTITVEVDEASVQKTPLATWQYLFGACFVDYAEVYEAIAVSYVSSGDNYECVTSQVIESK